MQTAEQLHLAGEIRESMRRRGKKLREKTNRKEGEKTLALNRKTYAKT